MNIQKLSSDAALAVGLVGLGASAIAGTVAVVATGTLPITLIVTAVASAALIAVGLVMRSCKETQNSAEIEKEQARNLAIVSGEAYTERTELDLEEKAARQEITESWTRIEIEGESANLFKEMSATFNVKSLVVGVMNSALERLTQAHKPEAQPAAILEALEFDEQKARSELLIGYQNWYTDVLLKEFIERPTPQVV